MTKRLSLFALLSVILATFALAAPAHAQATRTWVSGVGDDVNPCSRTAPCKTFAGAISKTAAGGEINCIDSGGYGAVTITKAITIDCANIEAGIVVAGSNAIIVSAGASDKVVLRGLDLIGTLITPAINGIVVNSANSVHVDKCLIRLFISAAPNGNGILVQPSSGNPSVLVTDTTLQSNVGAGVKVRPTGSGGANVTIVRGTSFSNNAGYVADVSAPTSGTVLMMVSQSTAASNSGIGISYVSTAASGYSYGFIDRSVTANNGTGITADGSHTGIVVGGTTIWESLSPVNGSAMQSFGNNQVIANGSFTLPMQPLK